jgi:hypothetical protein
VLARYRDYAGFVVPIFERATGDARFPMRRLLGTFQTDHGHCATVIASAPDASHPKILATPVSAPNRDPLKLALLL